MIKWIKKYFSKPSSNIDKYTCEHPYSDVHTAKRYTLEEIFEHPMLDHIDIVGEYYEESKYYTYLSEIVLCNEGNSAIVPIISFRKKACIKCHTCLDEWERGARYYLDKFNDEVNKLKMEVERDRLVNEICGGE